MNSFLRWRKKPSVVRVALSYGLSKRELPLQRQIVTVPVLRSRKNERRQNRLNVYAASIQQRRRNSWPFSDNYMLTLSRNKWECMAPLDFNRYHDDPQLASYLYGRPTISDFTLPRSLQKAKITTFRLGLNQISFFKVLMKIWFWREFVVARKKPRRVIRHIGCLTRWLQQRTSD